MKKKIIITLILTSSLFAWEINTHRAIDKTAIEKSNNFTTFARSTAPAVEYISDSK